MRKIGVIFFGLSLAIPLMLSAQKDTIRKTIIHPPWLSFSFQQELLPYKGPSYEYVTKIYGFKTGINITTWLSKCFYVNSGINYMQRKQQYSRAIYVELEATSITTLEMVSFDGYEYNGIQIPLIIGFVPYQNNKLCFKIQAGLGANIKLQEIYSGITVNGIYFENDEFVPSQRNIEPVHIFSPYNFNTGIGCNYHLNDKYTIGLFTSLDIPEPAGNSLSQNDLIANVEISISYKIKSND